MAPLTKEPIEVSTSIAEPVIAAPASQPKQAPASGQLRADALSLEIAVRVHGSRVTQVVRELTPHTEPFEEQTSTMIVFPQGAVLRMSTAVTVGQMLVLTNAKTGQDAICRVIKVRTFSNAQGYVEIEFSHAQPGYWGVNFSPDGSAPVTSTKPAIAPGAIQREEPKKESTSDISWAPARSAAPPDSQPAATIATPKQNPEPKPFAPPPERPGKPESSFILIGSQEETQVAASSTLRARLAQSPQPVAPVAAPPRIEPEREVRAPEPAKKPAAIDFPAAPPSVAVPSVSMTELLGDELTASALCSDAAIAQESRTHDRESAPPAESSARSSFGSFGSLSGGATITAAQSRHAELFGSRLDSATGGSSTPEAGARQSNFLLIAACIFVAFAVAVGGAFYFRQELGLQKSGAPTAAASGAAGQNGANGSRLDQPFALQGNQPAPGLVAAQPTVRVPGTTVTVSGADSAPSRASSAVSPPATSPAAAPASRQPARSVTSDMVASTLQAHPVMSSHTDANLADAAPTLGADAASNEATALPTGLSSENVASPPPPVVVPEGPVQVGGDVREPRLITLKQPVYPIVAKQAHIQGDILVSTQIDKVGNVVHMKVISGPTILRQAALDALRHWKYAPSTLNGQPVSVEMQVTLKFRM